MVFDWFKRSVGPSEPATTPPPPSPEPLPTPEAPASQAPEASSPPEASGDSPAEAVAAAASPAAVESPAAPVAAAGVDQDALAWARQAYARLKAQQEAAAQVAEVPLDQPGAGAGPESSEASGSSFSPAPPEASSAPQQSETAANEPLGAALADSPGAVVTPAPGPDLASTSSGAVAPLTVPEAPPSPSFAAPRSEPEALPSLPASGAPEPPPLAFEAAAAPAAGLSLLELAAAQREQRRQEILAASPVPEAEPEPVPPPAAPIPAAASPVADQAEPSLGAFDADFTWSAEVLAAQGRRVEEVSLEEIDWLTRLRRGLEKTRKGFVAQLLDTLGDDPLNADTLEDIESTLLRADVGVQATDRVLEALRQRLNEEVVDPAEGLRFLKEQLRAILEEPIAASGRELLAPEKDRLNVWLLVGVNGVGKTTTLGKLANLAVRSGYSCLIAAADTFRAAAVQQVSVWGERSGVPVVSNPSANADPAAVVYDAIGAARAKGVELVLVDTAGRLQTKHNLMEELSKVRRIVDKLAPEAVVQSLLVLDASQGQNGLRQAMAFASAAGLTGVVLTKLDGSARGGVALAVASEAGLPIRFVGAGETIRDLRPFNSFEFVEALLGG